VLRCGTAGEPGAHGGMHARHPRRPRAVAAQGRRRGRWPWWAVGAPQVGWRSGPAGGPVPTRWAEAAGREKEKTKEMGTVLACGEKQRSKGFP